MHLRKDEEMNQKTLRMMAFAALLTLLASDRLEAGSDGEEFYRGKVIRVIVGFSPGGGFDTFARIVARYMGKYVPGNPTVIVENMTGAGSLIAANHIYK